VRCLGYISVTQSSPSFARVRLHRRRPFRRSRSLEVTDFGTNRKLIYDFLLVVNTNLPSILHRIGDTAFQMLQIAGSMDRRCYGNRLVARVGENWQTPSSFSLLAFDSYCLDDRKTDEKLSLPMNPIYTVKFRELWSSNLWDLLVRLPEIGGCTYAKIRCSAPGPLVRLKHQGPGPDPPVQRKLTLLAQIFREIKFAVF